MTEEMSTFHLDKFRRAEFVRRTERVPVPSLASFFDGPAVIEVQSLNGPELFLAEDRPKHNEVIEKIIGKLESAQITVKVQAAMDALGISDDVPKAVVKMIAYVELGCKSVDLTQADAVRLFEYSIDSFLTLHQTIHKLTMMGFANQGELRASGATQG